MKRYIILAVFSIVLTANLNAQVGDYSYVESTSDGFFTQNYEAEYREYSEWGAMPRMLGHGITTNQDAPLGSGLLLLAGMGVAYGIKRKLKSEN